METLGKYLKRLLMVGHMVWVFACLSEEELKLTIANGYYQEVQDGTAIHFEYWVEGELCKVGGYGIEWNDRGGIVDWYIMQTLRPGQTHTIDDTFSIAIDSVHNPVVSMQGYREDDTSSDERLHAQYRLRRR